MTFLPELVVAVVRVVGEVGLPTTRTTPTTRTRAPGREVVLRRGYRRGVKSSSEGIVMNEQEKRPDEQDDANDPKTAPVDGPGGDEGEGGLGSTSQGSPGEVEGGGTSGA